MQNIQNIQSFTNKFQRLSPTVSNGTLWENFETVGEFVKQSAGGTVEEDVTNVKVGSKAVKLTSGSGTNCFADKTISADLSAANTIGFWVYVPSLTGLSSIAVYFSSTTNYSKYFSKTIQATSLHEGWNYLLIARSDWNNTGSESWTNTMLRLRIRINASAGTPNVTFDGMYIGVLQRPRIIITFDDGWDDTYVAYQYMVQKSMPGVAYVIAEKVGTAGYMTLENLNTIYSNGWDLCVHGSTNLTTLENSAAMEAEVLANQELLTTNDFTRNDTHLHYAYPNGGYNDDAITALTSLEFLTARTIIDRIQGNVIDNSLLLTRRVVINTTSLATAQGYVDAVINTGGCYLLNFHKLVESPSVDTEWDVNNFYSLVDYIDAKRNAGLVDVLPITAWYNSL